jgi:hypothetical protein
MVRKTMEENEFLKLLKELRRRLPNVYRHVVGIVRAALEAI